MKPSKTLVALVAGAASLLAACGSAESSTNPNYVQVNPLTTAAGVTASGSAGSAGNNTTANTAGASGAPTAVVITSTTSITHSAAGAGAQVESSEFDRVIAAYDDFLGLRAESVIGYTDPASLDQVATANGIAQVAAWRADNDDRVAQDRISAMTELAEWSNVTSVQSTARGVSFIDCTERQHLNKLGSPDIRFVTNQVAMVEENGTYKVDSVTELQNGSWTETADEYGCAPPSFVARTESVATRVIDEVAALMANPDTIASGRVPAIFADEARTDIEQAAAYLSSEKLTRTADEQVTIEVLGMEVNYPDFTVVVSVCRYYPNGRVFVDARTGTPRSPGLASGSSEAELMYVRLEPVASGNETADAAIAVEAVGANCWTG